MYLPTTSQCFSDVCIYFVKKTGWAPFWATFLQTHPVTLPMIMFRCRCTFIQRSAAKSLAAIFEGTQVIKEFVLIVLTEYILIRFVQDRLRVTRIFAYFRLFLPIFAYFRLFSPIFAYFRLFSPIFAYFRLFSPIFAYFRLLGDCLGTLGSFSKNYSSSTDNWVTFFHC
jgi:hypothetical protein